MEAVSTYRIAALTGLTQATLSRLKYGETNPSIDTLERIAKVLKVQYSEIQKFKEDL
jgi:transcriptional regulator with XRE-family HTH domain